MHFQRPSTKPFSQVLLGDGNHLHEFSLLSEQIEVKILLKYQSKNYIYANFCFTVGPNYMNVKKRCFLILLFTFLPVYFDNLLIFYKITKYSGEYWHLLTTSCVTELHYMANDGHEISFCQNKSAWESTKNSLAGQVVKHKGEQLDQ